MKRKMMLKNALLIFLLASIIFTIIGCSGVEEGGEPFIVNADVWGVSAEDVFIAGYAMNLDYDGFVKYYDGHSWEYIHKSNDYHLWGIWGHSVNDVFAVGDRGGILHHDGNEWTATQVGDRKESFHDAWGSSPDDVWAVGDVIAHFDDIEWTIEDIDYDLSQRSNRLWGIWGSSSSDVFAVGGYGMILHFNGEEWKKMESGTNITLENVWGSSASDVFAVGGSPGNNIILHYDGSDWTTMEIDKVSSINSISGNSSKNVYAVGGYGVGDGDDFQGVIYHFNGKVWVNLAYKQQLLWNQSLGHIWVAPGGEYFIIGAYDTIFQFP